MQYVFTSFIRSTRNLPRRVLPWIGRLLDKLPYSRLPTNSSVLKRLHFLTESNDGKTSVDAAAITVKNELVEIWTYAGYGDILHDSSYILKMIKSLAILHKSLNKIPVSRRSAPSFLQKESSFKETLPKLCNITVKGLRESNLITADDRNFLKNHWSKPISSTPDLKLKKAVQKKLDRQEKYDAYLSQQASSSQPATTSPSPASSTASSSPSSATSSDTDFTPKRPCTTPRSSGITLHLPKDILKRVGPTADRLGLSNNQLTAVTAVLTNHGGGDIEDIPLSKSTTRRSRIQARKQKVDDIKESFQCSHAQVNFDGKLLKDLGGFEKVNRLAVVLVQEAENQILGMVQTDDATGKVEAEAVKSTLDSWEIAGKIIAIGFDTPWSNTGVHKGSCTILQDLLQRQLLWLACRHHILELILKATFQKLFGNTSGPEESFFKFLKPQWNSLNLTDISRPQIPAFYRADVPDLLSFINQCLEPSNSHLIPRGDYKELLELSVLVLGGTIKRKRGYIYQIQRPGADHHARWMSKAIYTLKVTLLLPQLTTLPWYRKKQLEKMTLYIVFVYLRSWFTAPLLYSAGTADLELQQRMRKFSRVHKKLAEVGETVLQRHTWYLTEELLPLCLFSPGPPDTLNKVAQLISKLPDYDLPLQKPTLPTILPGSSLPDFVGPRSTLIFKLLKVSHSFLSSPDWRSSPEFKKVKEALNNLTPVNDSCERALALATTFNGVITKDETSFQELVLVVDSHRKKFKLEKKKDLKKLM